MGWGEVEESKISLLTPTALSNSTIFSKEKENIGIKYFHILICCKVLIFISKKEGEGTGLLICCKLIIWFGKKLEQKGGPPFPCPNFVKIARLERSMVCGGGLELLRFLSSPILCFKFEKWFCSILGRDRESLNEKKNNVPMITRCWIKESCRCYSENLPRKFT